MEYFILQHFILYSIFLIIPQTQSSSILFLVMPQSASHRRSLYPFAETLASRGHRVTFFAEVVDDEGIRCRHANITNEFAYIEHDEQQFIDLWMHRNSTMFGYLQWK